MSILTDAELSAIARDMETIALVEAFGSPSAKPAARRQPKVCRAAMKADIEARNLPAMTDDELLAALGV